MKIGDIYGPSRPRTVKAKPEPKPAVQSLEASSMLCKVGMNIYLNHHYVQGWLCKRCGLQLDVSKLFKK